MKTIGYKLTALSPTRGASAELAASLTVVTASYIGLPVSTTSQEILGAFLAMNSKYLFSVSLQGFNHSMHRRSCCWHWLRGRMENCAVVVSCQSLRQLGYCVLYRSGVLGWHVRFLLLLAICYIYHVLKKTPQHVCHPYCLIHGSD